MKRIKTAWIIHIFAILHAAVALGCRAGGIEDELFLTVLTMSMALLICLKKAITVEFTAAIVIVVNILGYFIGTLGADLMELFISSPYIVHALSTAITTELLGWSIVMITKLFRQDASDERESMLSASYLKWILLAVVGIFFIRLAIVLFFSDGDSGTGDLFKIAGKVMSNTFVMTILICIDIMYIRYVARMIRKMPKTRRNLIFVAFMLGTSLLETILTGVNFPLKDNRFLSHDFFMLFSVSLLIQITVYCLIFIINYAITARSEMQEEREKANMAQYRYVKLKRQVNPHFLFNSLNILDCLICEEKTEQASLYTHKLASIYRYMIKSEEEDVVPLRDELVFVELYVDLLKVRFPEGFEVEIEVPEEAMARFVPPCSIQLLIENATKHNAVGTEKPLTIRVEASAEDVRVSNNLIPKVTRNPSTGLGQKYIRQLYLDLSGKHIGIDKTEDNYCVTLPLL